MEYANKQYIPKNHFTWAILILVTLLAGCANFSNDGGFSQVEKMTMEKSGVDIQWARSSQDQDRIDSRIDQLLSTPLAVEDAVQIALLNNKELQAEFYELGISEADLVQAGRLPNPRFSMLYGRNSSDYKIEQSFTFNIFSLLTMPRAIEIEKRRFEETQKKISVKVLRLASETRKAYITALAAKESVQYMQQVKNAAEASSELARKMAIAGNFNKLDQAREQSFYADAALGLARALQAKTVAMERLTRLMSLWGNDAHYQLSERLPDLPAKAEELPEIEKLAMEQRLDIQSMKFRIDALAAQLGLTKTTRFINVLELGPARVLEGDRGDPYKKGFEIAFEVPIFDWGAARVVRAESIYMQAVNQLSAAAVDAKSEVRESYFRYRSSYDIAWHYQNEIVPLSKRIMEEKQLRYNGMLVSVFDLLAKARSQVISVNSYIESLRDFWLAQSNMEMSLIGKPSFSEFNTS